MRISKKIEKHLACIGCGEKNDSWGKEYCSKCMESVGVVPTKPINDLSRQEWLELEGVLDFDQTVADYMEYWEEF